MFQLGPRADVLCRRFERRRRLEKGRCHELERNADRSRGGLTGIVGESGAWWLKMVSLLPDDELELA